MQPVISIVLSTYNRAELVGGALDSLLALDPATPHEIIVVDNNSTDRTREVVEAAAADAGGRLRYAFEPRQGVSHARNRGITLARAPLVAFTDDDVRVDARWAAAVVRAFERHPEAAFVGGKVLPMWPSPPPAWLGPRNWSPLALLDYGDEGFEASMARPLCLVSANLAFRRDVVARFGGFDPFHQHQPGAVSAIEDFELELRMYRAGLTGWYEPSAVIHAEVQPHRLTRAYSRRWHFDHGRALERMVPPGHYLTADWTARPQRPGARRVFNVPLAKVRELGGAAARAVRAAAGPGEVAVSAAGRFWETLGTIHYLATAGRAPVLGARAPLPPLATAGAPLADRAVATQVGTDARNDAGARRGDERPGGPIGEPAEAGRSEAAR